MYQTPKRHQSIGPVLLFLFVSGLAVILAGLIGIGGGFYAAIFAVALALAFVGIADYRVCVVALIIMLPLSGTYFFPRKLFGLTGMNPFNLLLLLAFASFFLSRMFIRQKEDMPISGARLFWPLIVAMLIAAYIGSGHVHQIPMFYRLESPELFETRIQYYRDALVKPLLIFSFVWLMAAGVAKSKRAHGWIAALLIGAISIAMLVLLFVALSGFSLSALATTSARSFLSPTGLHANEIGIALIPAFAACLFMLPHVKSLFARFILMCFGGLFMVALLLTFSRAALLALLIVSVVFVFKRRKLAWLLGGMITLSLAVLFAPQPVKDRVARGFESGSVGARNDPLTAGRVGGIWKPLIPEIGRHPILGNGIHSTLWSDAARSGTIFVAHPHNAYIQLLLDYGFLLGSLVVLFLARVWRLWRSIVKDPQADPVVRAFFDGVSVAFIAFLVQGMSGSTLVFEITHAVYLGAIGIALGLAAKRTQTAAAAGPATRRSRWKQPVLLQAGKGRAWG